MQTAVFEEKQMFLQSLYRRKACWEICLWDPHFALNMTFVAQANRPEATGSNLAALTRTRRLIGSLGYDISSIFKWDTGCTLSTHSTIPPVLYRAVMEKELGDLSIL